MAGAATGVLMLIALATDGVAQSPSGERPSALGAATIPAPAARLEAPPMILGAPATEIGLGLVLVRNGASPANTYVRIRGLLPQMALSDGHMIAPGSWAVPIAALPDLRLLIPPGAAGRSEITAALVTVDGGVVSEAKSTLVVAAAATQPQPVAPEFRPPLPSASLADERLPPRTLVPRPPAPSIEAAPSVPAAPPVVAALPPPRNEASGSSAREQREPARAPVASQPPADRARSEALLARGRKLLDDGDFASARLFLRRAADDGLAEAALALGATFDPAELPRMKSVGIKPDPAEARRWYEKARELGAGDAASQRLQRLGAAR